MSRPPIKAITAIKNYCEKTQCRRCVFGRTIDYDGLGEHYVSCMLVDKNPCDWEIDKEAENEDSN